MADERLDRRLSAVLAADVAGYSRLVGADEEGTLRRPKSLQADLFLPSFAEHRGRLVKTTGDGLLAEFASVVDAVRCAVHLQRWLVVQNASLEPDKRIDLRIGVHVGDIVVEKDGDILRWRGGGPPRSPAQPGGISRLGMAGGRRRPPDVAFADQGEQQLKNIVRPVRRLSSCSTRWGRTERRARDGGAGSGRALISRPAGDCGPAAQNERRPGEQSSLPTVWSRTSLQPGALSLDVIARNSTFTTRPRGRREAGRPRARARFVLEGSVRKVGQRIRITAQLR